jgi:hypothetical protein
MSSPPETSGSDSTEPLIVFPKRPPVQQALARKRPLARFDIEGVECAAGRISWGDVESAALAETDPDWHGVTLWLLLFRLRAGAQPLTPSGDYYRGRGHTRVRCSEQSLALPLWASAPSVLAAVRRFYDGPSTDFLPYDEPRGWPGEDIGSFTDDRERDHERKRRLILEDSDS